ncbi:hypothetical protein V8J82_06580 [Gymnodinialimonas sp. 2305UL16-5]|uniref:hypothetical protein n=1 Tax=Gymnodinialimonas mytili TaxID=3126503 RepID=UPI0030AB6C98
MFVAGSVVALLLAGMAVDGLAAPEDEETGRDPDDIDNDDYEDVAGSTTSVLSDLLFPEDVVEDSSVQPEAIVEPVGTDTGFLGEDYYPSEEALADSDWLAASLDAPLDDMIEVESLTILADGTEVPFVDDFEPDTDQLVLDFDGSASDAPEIGIDTDSEPGAAIVLANGLPITLVEGATDMTPDHVRVVMSEDSDGSFGDDDNGDGGTHLEEGSISPIGSSPGALASGVSASATGFAFEDEMIFADEPNRDVPMPWMTNGHGGGAELRPGA